MSTGKIIVLIANCRIMHRRYSLPVAV